MRFPGEVDPRWSLLSSSRSDPGSPCNYEPSFIYPRRVRALDNSSKWSAVLSALYAALVSDGTSMSLTPRYW